MNRQLIALSVGALMTAASAPALAQTSGPGVGTPLQQGPNASTSRVGTRGANFLEIGLGARAVGMAGAYASVAEGLSGLYWNLAGTADVTNIAAGVNYSQLFGSEGLDFVWGGVVIPVGGGAVGLQIGQMSSGTMERTTLDNPQGGDLQAGTGFEFTATAAEISYARRLTDRLSVGLGAKYAQEGITQATASYIGADVGVRFRTGLYGTTLGASLSNVGSSGKYEGNLINVNLFNDPQVGSGVIPVEFDTRELEMPTIFRFSVAAELIGGPEAMLSQRSDVGLLRVVGDFSNAIDTDLQTAVGAEYAFRDRLFLRVGKRFLNEQGLDDGDNGLSSGDEFGRGMAFGGGLRLPLAGRRVGFDYAWQGAGELPAHNHFTFEFGF
jgi:hypothetical protein